MKIELKMTQEIRKVKRKDAKKVKADDETAKHVKPTDKNNAEPKDVKP